MSVPGERLQTQSRHVAQPLRWPLASKIDQRDLSLLQDSRIINGYTELDQVNGGYKVYKRPGVSTAAVYSPLSGSLGRGAYFWAYSGTNNSVPYQFGPTVLFVVGDNLNYSIGTQPQGSISLTPSTANRQDMVSFVSANSAAVATGGPGVFFNTVESGYFFNPANTLVGTLMAKYGPAGLTVPLLPNCVYLDTAVYMMDASGNIWGSNPGDVSTWSGVNFINAGLTAQSGMGLARQLNYIIAFYLYNTAVFYDAGNSPGSPLGAVTDAEIPFGCCAAWSIKMLDNLVFWIASGETPTPQVVQLAALTPKVISTPAVERILMNIGLSYYPNSMQAPMLGSDTYGWTLKIGGHRFYGITSIPANLTLVYDIDQEMWYIWTDTNGNYWSIITAFGIGPTAGNTFISWLCQDRTFGKIYTVGTCYQQPLDRGNVYPLDIYTPNLDFGTMRSKTVHALYFNADRIDTQLQVRHSDDDYKTWSSFRQVNLNSAKPMLADEGTYEWRRAYHLRAMAAQGLRMASMDLQLDVGTI